MNEIELQQLAREYGTMMAKDIPISNCLKNEAINTTEEDIFPFLQWLSSRYCLVKKKSKVLSTFHEHKNGMDIKFQSST